MEDSYPQTCSTPSNGEIWLEMSRLRTFSLIWSKQRTTTRQALLLRMPSTRLCYERTCQQSWLSDIRLGGMQTIRHVSQPTTVRSRKWVAVPQFNLGYRHKVQMG